MTLYLSKILWAIKDYEWFIFYYKTFVSFRFFHLLTLNSKLTTEPWEKNHIYPNESMGFQLCIINFLRTQEISWADLYQSYSIKSRIQLKNENEKRTDCVHVFMKTKTLLYVSTTHPYHLLSSTLMPSVLLPIQNSSMIQLSLDLRI